MMMRILKILGTVLTSLFFISCSDDDEAPNLHVNNFANPVEIEILGYTGSAMEPFISEDGQYLFFNNPSEGTLNGDLHYAIVSGGNSFDYQGLIQGVNSIDFEGAPSMDASGNFYYTSLETYTQNFLSIYKGTFSNGIVSSVVPVDQKLTLNQGGMVDMDAVISNDGETLILAIAKFTTNNYPDESNFVIANRVNGEFIEDVNSDKILENINTDAVEYAASLSSDGLELFFNRSKLSVPPFEFKIMVATRASKNDPFGIPQKVDAILREIVEGPCLSSSGKDLYYHLKENGVFKIFKVTRI